MEKETEKEQLCPACGCHIGEDPYTKNTVVYCCKACATGSQCDCGCCEITEPPVPLK